MRFNTNRSGRFAFGALVDDYDAGRRRLDADVVAGIRRRLGTADSGQPRVILEVGAGTGQLTDALLDSGDAVTAVEPSDPLRARLERHRAVDIERGRLRTVDLPFEQCPSVVEESSVDELWSADAFHWIDPELAYDTAVRLLRPGGWIVLLWTFPIIADAGLQQNLNELYQRLSPDLVRDPAIHPADLEPVLRRGREQLLEAAAFETPVSWMDRSSRLVSIDQYVALQCSFGQISQLAPERLRALRDGITERLTPGDRVELTHHDYVLAARARRRT